MSLDEDYIISHSAREQYMAATAQVYAELAEYAKQNAMISPEKFTEMFQKVKVKQTETKYVYVKLVYPLEVNKKKRKACIGLVEKDVYKMLVAADPVIPLSDHEKGGLKFTELVEEMRSDHYTLKYAIGNRVTEEEMSRIVPVFVRDVHAKHKAALESVVDCVAVFEKDGKFDEKKGLSQDEFTTKWVNENLANIAKNSGAIEEYMKACYEKYCDK